MKSQLLFVVILVTLGHSSAFLRGLAACKWLVQKPLPGITAKRLGQRAFFDAVEVVAGQHLFNLGPLVFNKTSIDALIQGDHSGTDYFLDSICQALNISCDGIETARKQIHTCISDAFLHALEGVELALGKYYMKNRVAVEVAESKTRAVAVKLLQLLYDVIRSNLKSKDADTLNAIQVAENQSIISTLNDVDGFFDAGKLLGIAVANGNKDISLIADLEECWDKSVTGLRYSSYSIYAVLEALHINTCGLDTAGLLSTLTILHYSRLWRIHDMMELPPEAFGVVIGLVENIAFNISINTEVLCSQLDIVLGNIRAILVFEGEIFFKSVLAISPEYLYKVEEARKKLRIEIDTAVGAFGNIGKVSLIQFNATAFADVITYHGIRYVKILLDLIPTSKTWSNEVKAEMLSFKKQALSSANGFFQGARDALNVFEKFISSNNTYNYKDATAAISAAGDSAETSALAYVDATINSLQISLFAGNHGKQCSH